MKDKIIGLLAEAVHKAAAAGLMPDVEASSVELEYAKDTKHGDYASNIAMIMASQARKNPREIARIIADGIVDDEGILKKVEIAGPGFLNFTIREGVWASLLADVERLGDAYGKSTVGAGKKIMVEFVSANPTGPLHIGHARGAVVGDVMANILAAAGYAVFREYYVNDAGNQMNNLGKSVSRRYQELRGRQVEFVEGLYQGDYIKDIAAEIMKKDKDVHLDRDEADVIPEFTAYAAGAILEGIKEDLRLFGVSFDSYFSERELYKNEGVEKLLQSLEDKGIIYREEGTVWFKTTLFGDEKDRVVIRQNGLPTYFAADIAYHQNKFLRGFERIIDIWGADHHGYIPRMSAAVQALGYDKESLQVILVQLVNLLRDGKPVAMSTRSGEFVTLREVVDEVGRDAARYNFLMRRSDSHLDFDLEVAKKQSIENPVYYVQYAHARICSILKMAEEKGFKVPRLAEVDAALLQLPAEIELIKAIIRFPGLIEGAAQALEPHRLTFYLNDLAASFHSYYNKNKVLSDDLALSGARLFLVHSLLAVLKNAFKILGVSAPEKM
ncbi:MAG: arginine--tRNA ligase [Syntrophales bacterium]|jgi:arginyl-tRNA synthetase|nr:arginine--tRNA ligase [Syntrophales bacterium]